MLVVATACTGGAGSAPAAPAVQRKVVSVSTSPAASPMIVSTGGSSAAQAASSLRSPTDGQQFVMVDSTDGQGVWVRRQPAGEPLRVWPDGAPMLLVGED